MDFWVIIIDIVLCIVFQLVMSLITNKKLLSLVTL